ncbi:unnamed protein product [Agarophyton chilense]
MLEELQTSSHVPHADLNAATRLFGRAFRAGMPLRQIFDQTQALFGDIAWKTPLAQKTLLHETVLYQSSLTQRIPGFCFGHSRCARFFRLLMDEVDRCSKGEVDESFVELAAQHCLLQKSSQRNVHIVHYMPDGQEVVLAVSERFSDLGARVWEAGLRLCFQLFDARSALHQDVRGASVLELGAGTGLSGQAYVKAGAKHVLLTDYKQELIGRIKENLGNNNVPDTVQATLLDANDLPRLRSVVDEFDVDVIVAADVTYDDDLIEIMVRAFSDSITGPRVGYLLATDRNAKTTCLLRQELLKTGLTAVEVLFSVADSSCRPLTSSNCNRVSTLKLKR